MVCCEEVSLDNAVVVVAVDVRMCPAGRFNTVQTTRGHGSLVPHPILLTQGIPNVSNKNLIGASRICIADPTKKKHLRNGGVFACKTSVF